MNPYKSPPEILEFDLNTLRYNDVLKLFLNSRLMKAIGFLSYLFDDCSYMICYIADRASLHDSLCAYTERKIKILLYYLYKDLKDRGYYVHDSTVNILENLIRK